jgi:hypothetical protein
MASGDPAATTEMVSGAVAVWAGEPESLTVTPKDRLLPLTVGVPEMIPVVGARLRPAGREPVVMDQV